MQQGAGGPGPAGGGGGGTRGTGSLDERSTIQFVKVLPRCRPDAEDHSARHAAHSEAGGQAGRKPPVAADAQAGRAAARSEAADGGAGRRRRGRVSGARVLAEEVASTAARARARAAAAASDPASARGGEAARAPAPAAATQANYPPRADRVLPAAAASAVERSRSALRRGVRCRFHRSRDRLRFHATRATAITTSASRRFCARCGSSPALAPTARRCA